VVEVDCDIACRFQAQSVATPARLLVDAVDLGHLHSPDVIQMGFVALIGMNSAMWSKPVLGHNVEVSLRLGP
jgi:hypothetical protein